MLDLTGFSKKWEATNPEYSNLSIVDKERVKSENLLVPKYEMIPESFIELFKKIEVQRTDTEIAKKFNNRGKVVLYLDDSNCPPSYLHSNILGNHEHPSSQLINTLSNDVIAFDNTDQGDIASSIIQTLNLEAKMIREFSRHKFIFVSNWSINAIAPVFRDVLKRYGRANMFGTDNQMHLMANQLKKKPFDEQSTEVVPYCFPSRFKTVVGTLNKDMEPHEDSNYGKDIKIFTLGPENGSPNFISATSNMCIVGLIAKLWEKFNTQEEVMKALYALAIKKEVSYPGLPNHEIYIIDPRQLTVIDGEIVKKSVLFYYVSGQPSFGQWSVEGNTKKSTISLGFSPSNFLTRSKDVHFNWSGEDFFTAG